VVVPMLIPLPELRPIEYVIPHDLPYEAVHRWAQTRLEEGDGLDLEGNWEGDTFVVREPIAGYIRFEAREIAAHFDPPMWVPSQRADFEMKLSKWLKALSTSPSR